MGIPIKLSALNTSDWLATIAILVAIFALIVGALVACYIAFRQGVFKRAKVQMRVGLDDAALVNSRTSLAITGLPKTNAKQFLVLIPYILATEAVAVKNVWLQLTYPSKRVPSKLPPIRTLEIQTDSTGKKSCVMSKYSLAFPPDDSACQRTVRRTGERTFVEYEIPVLRSEERMIVVDVVSYEKADFRPKAGARDPEPVAETVTCFLRSENHPPIKQHFYLAATRSDNMEELVSKTRQTEELVKSKLGSIQMRIIDWLFYKISKRPFGWTHMFVRQPEFKVAAEGTTAVDCLLLGGGPGTYVNGETGFYLL